MDGGSGIGGTFIVRHDDTDPTAQYGMKYGDLTAGVDLNLKNMTFFVPVRVTGSYARVFGGVTWVF